MSSKHNNVLFMSLSGVIFYKIFVLFSPENFAEFLKYVHDITQLLCTE